MLKDRLKNVINDIIEDFKKNIKNSNVFKSYNLTKLGSIKQVLALVENTNFVSYIPEEFKSFVNEYNCFYNRESFYYDISLESRSDLEISEIFFCEFFNNWQNTFTPYNCLTENKKKKTVCNSLLFMHHIGIIKEKMHYSRYRRDMLMQDVLKHNHKPIFFYPNEQAQEYFINELMNGNELFGFSEKSETYEVIECNMRAIYLSCTKTYGITFNTESNYTLFYNIENNKIKRYTRRNDIVKEHEESMEIVKTLSRY